MKNKTENGKIDKASGLNSFDCMAVLGQLFRGLGVYNKHTKGLIPILVEHIYLCNNTAILDQHKIYNFLDREFNRNEELAFYDNFHKIIKINSVLQNSLK